MWSAVGSRWDSERRLEEEGEERKELEGGRQDGQGWGEEEVLNYWKGGAEELGVCQPGNVTSQAIL